MMHHTQIAQRVFNTPLMVDPAKALAFLTGLGPRITGREISVEGLEIMADDQATAVNRHRKLPPYRRPKMTPSCTTEAGPMRCRHHTAQPRRASGVSAIPGS